MKCFITMILFAGILAGCTAASSQENATQAPSSGGNRGSLNVTENSAAETSSGENSGGVNRTEASPTEASPMETPVNNATSDSKPNGIRVGPPMLPIGSAPLLEGWRTYTSTALGVALNYPDDWSVAENDASVRFTSSQGQLILLQMDQSNGSSSTTGQDCAILINSYGQAGDFCYDAATSAYRAVFKKSADESTPWLILSVISPEKPTVFYQMFDSFRFTP